MMLLVPTCHEPSTPTSGLTAQRFAGNISTMECRHEESSLIPQDLQEKSATCLIVSVWPLCKGMRGRPLRRSGGENRIRSAWRYAADLGKRSSTRSSGIPRYVHFTAAPAGTS
jgi:hypothetical protein